MTNSDSEQRALLVLGARLNQLPAIRHARSRGLRTIAIDPDPDAPGMAMVDDAYVADLADLETCVEIARQANCAGVFTLGADYPIPLLARICQELSLPGLTPDVALTATNKHRMRLALELAGLPSPRSTLVDTPAAATAAYRGSSGDTIFKPVRSSGGRGIVALTADAELETVRRAFEYAAKFDVENQVLVEQLVEGPEFSVELFIVDGDAHVVAVTEKQTTGSPHFVEIGHNQPPRFAKDVVRAVEATAVATARAIGLNNSPAHVEIVHSAEGPFVVEIGARLGGGFIATHLVPLSTGIDAVAAGIALALGEWPCLEPACTRGSAIRFLTGVPGRVRECSGLEAAQACAGVQEMTVYVARGDMVAELKDATARLGHVICDGATATDAIESAESALSCITLVMEPASERLGTMRTAG